MLAVLGIYRAPVAIGKNVPVCASVENPGLQI